MTIVVIGGRKLAIRRGLDKRKIHSFCNRKVQWEIIGRINEYGC